MWRRKASSAVRSLSCRPATRSKSTSTSALIHLHVSDEELARRKAAWTKPAPKYPRGYGAMFSEHIGQADEGCDFDFLAPLGENPGAGNSLK